MNKRDTLRRARDRNRNRKQGRGRGERRKIPKDCRVVDGDTRQLEEIEGGRNE